MTLSSLRGLGRDRGPVPLAPMGAPAASQAIAGLAEVWGSLVELGRSLGDEEFDVATSCPGWTVKDQFSHVIGTELLLEGAAAPTEAALAEHVHNDLGELNERFVAARRGLRGPEVVAELADLFDRRLDALASLDAEAWSTLGPSPVGMVPYVDYMGLRAFDCWVHEQDVRLALDRPGGRGGHGERITLDRMEASMPFVLGRRVGAPAGTTLRLEVTGPLGRTIQLVVAVRDDGSTRATSTDVLDAVPTATIELDAEGFVRRACGRASAASTLRRPSTHLGGDRSLAEQFVELMVVVP
jgi:uncharacterized protein (TIGR03083 family)